MIRQSIKRWWRQTTARRRRRPPFHRTRLQFFEPLEERLVLDGVVETLPPAIVVGRTLSAYTTAAVQNNQLDITYTVYNQQPEPVTGVLLTDTLLPGVTFQTASQLPDRDGQNLAWSLGTIEGFDRASVTLTVSLTDLTQPIDVGARAFATLNAGMESDDAPAARLRQGSVDPALLASTPDANTNDPFIQEAAARIDYDPQTVFDLLHTVIDYNSYFGSVRGARGTLWSLAGNSLDTASLGVALLRASGIPAQYVQGTLSDSQAEMLILSMFPENFQLNGHIPVGQPTSDPAHDPQLLAETKPHAWFQFDVGSGMTDADPLMPGATVGQAFTAATDTFSQVPDALREKTRIQLEAEQFNPNPLTALTGELPHRTLVLDRTFNNVELVGHPLTVGNFVNTSTTGFTIGTVTHTYAPYLSIGDVANPDAIRDELITGTPFQEVFTNFAFSTQILTGLFLTVTLSGPQGTPQTYERALYDGIGYDVRQYGVYEGRRTNQRGTAYVRNGVGSLFRKKVQR